MADKPEKTASTAVIVAAGKGERLLDTEFPKPLVSLVGVPLIGRVMASAARAGIDKFVVVLGCRAGVIRERLPQILPKGCELEILENPRYEEPNGVSLMVAVSHLTEPFALFMSDHIFSPDTLRRALNRFGETGRNLLVVEDKRRFQGDIGDATLVSVRNEQVAQIAKNLEEYDAVDTGMFVLNPREIRSTLEKAGPAPSISDGMRILGKIGKLDAIDMNGGFWQDIDTPGDLEQAEQKLYQSLRKPGDGFLARHINRHISIFLSSRLWRFGINPNTVTIFTLLIGLASGLAFAQGSDLPWGLIGAGLLQLHSIIDGVDGELARLQHKETEFGFWFDIITDNMTHMAVFGGIGMGQIAGNTPGPWKILSILAVLGVAASFFAMAPLLNPNERLRRRIKAERSPGWFNR
jgi:CDP-L-myo-inositol myo-inositolphosphotransferase